MDQIERLTLLEAAELVSQLKVRYPFLLISFPSFRISFAHK